MARVTWLQHRAVIVAGAVVAVAVAVVIVVKAIPAHRTLASLAAHGCLSTASGGPRCETGLDFILARTADLNLTSRILLVLPVLAGTFIGAPLLSRELESGTVRFAWTQQAGRRRWLLGKLLFLAAGSALVTAALGLLGMWAAGPFESAGDASGWQQTQFARTGLMLPAWTLLGLAIGVFCGIAIPRVVAAMATTLIVVGGLTALNAWRLHDWILMIAPRVIHGAVVGVPQGPLNVFATQGDEQNVNGSWLVGGYYTGPGGKRLTDATAGRLANTVGLNVSGKGTGSPRWISQHHYSYLLSYQPAGRFWIFQGAEAVVMLGLATVVVAGTVWLVARRSG
jgi:hypothetical protein